MLTFRKGLKDGVPIALGYISVAFAFGNTDEIFGVSIQKKEQFTMRYMTGIILCSYAGWILIRRQTFFCLSS